MEILEPKWKNEKSYLQLRKEKKVTFEDDMPTMKTYMNNNLLTHTIENSKHMVYYDQTVKLIEIFIEDLRKNTMDKGARFSNIYFLHKGLKEFGREGRDALTK